MAVKDTGIGMSKEETAKLFGEFVRIKNAKTRNILGSGLGLSILRKLATLYGGDVTVASQPDVGTTFTVHLPAVAPGNGVA
jgi:signal transduction histidine kinase